MSKPGAVVFGASGGIGAAYTLLLASEGWKVHAGARSLPHFDSEAIAPFCFDYAEEDTIARAAAEIGAEPIDMAMASAPRKPGR